MHIVPHPTCVYVKDPYRVRKLQYRIIVQPTGVGATPRKKGLRLKKKASIRTLKRAIPGVGAAGGAEGLASPAQHSLRASRAERAREESHSTVRAGFG